MIDLSSRETHLLLNPRLPEGDRGALERLARDVPQLEAHVWIATSGTTGALRLVALSKRAILASAEAVNRHLHATGRDVWICVLPTFHVGGLGIFARAALLGSRVISSAWDARQFIRTVAAENVTLASLVPAQVRDLVALGDPAPPAMRAIVVGGGAFSLDLYSAARARGWPVLPSYGMTEACSQIATAKDASPELEILSHMEARAEADGRLAFRGASLLTGYAFYDIDGRASFADPKVDGWFVSQDLGSVDGDTLRVSGRAGEFVKIGGETVDLARLDNILESVRGTADAAIVAVSDDRLGHVIHLATTVDDASPIRDAFNARVLPFERIREVRRVAAIPRSPLGKLLRSKLLSEWR
ncbi:MAG TPA: AMP-binding protein [Thermoanaerobaculia bacterium]|nr:AMP-binding protein [Thermoanaerobaculia bacterium]